MQWKLTDDRPIWTQLTEQLTERIVSGVYPLGSRMPSVRDLAAQAGVNLSARLTDAIRARSRRTGRCQSEHHAACTRAAGKRWTGRDQSHRRTHRHRGRRRGRTRPPESGRRQNGTLRIRYGHTRLYRNTGSANAAKPQKGVSDSWKKCAQALISYRSIKMSIPYSFQAAQMLLNRRKG